MVFGGITFLVGTTLILIHLKTGDNASFFMNGLQAVIIGVVLVILMTSLRNDVVRESRLEEEFRYRAVSTTAIVIASEPRTNIFGATVSYTLIAEQEINGMRFTFRSRGNAFRDNPIHDFQIGDTVPVLFDPIDASNNRIDMDLLK